MKLRLLMEEQLQRKGKQEALSCLRYVSVSPLDAISHIDVLMNYVAIPDGLASKCRLLTCL